MPVALMLPLITLVAGLYFIGRDSHDFLPLSGISGLGLIIFSVAFLMGHFL